MRSADELQDGECEDLYRGRFDNDDEQVIEMIEPGSEEPFLLEFLIRPFVTKCLQLVNTQYEVAVFTAGFDWYANPLIDFIDPTGTLIQHRFFRQHTTTVSHLNQTLFVKDLSVFAG